jgi:hypothetical protein
MRPDARKKLLEMADGMLATTERLPPGQNRTNAFQLIRGFASEISLHLDRRALSQAGGQPTPPSPSGQDSADAGSAAVVVNNI